MIRLLIRLSLLMLVSVQAEAGVITFVSGSEGGTQPSINDFGEIIWGRSGPDVGGTSTSQIVSNVSGVILQSSSIDFSNLGFSNSGEVVYGDFSGGVTKIVSTTRGTVVDSVEAYGPSIAKNTGEVSYSGITAPGRENEIYTTFQGKVSVRGASDRIGVSAVNDTGEVVYENRVNCCTNGNTQIFSSSRGEITPITVNAIAPTISSSGEIVWSQYVELGAPGVYYYALFSSTRGQLTFQQDGFEVADLPDIASDGTIVFRGIPYDRENVGIYTLSASPVPEPGIFSLLSLGLLGLFVTRRRQSNLSLK